MSWRCRGSFLASVEQLPGARDFEWSPSSGKYTNYLCPFVVTCIWIIYLSDMCCSPGTVFPIVNVLPGMIESFWSTTQRYPWLWGIYFFIVGLPVILFISFMWPDKVVIHPSICNETTKMLLKCKYYRLNTQSIKHLVIVTNFIQSLLISGA